MGHPTGTYCFTSEFEEYFLKNIHPYRVKLVVNIGLSEHQVYVDTGLAQ